jgi:integrase
MLTDSKIKAAKAKEKAYKIADRLGLHLFVSTAGAKVFRFRYRIHGREKMISLGAYPDVRLKEARDKRDEFRRLVSQGIDPSEQRRAEKLAHANTFKAIAEEWLAAVAKPEKNGRATMAPTTIEKIRRRLERFIYPSLGGQGIATISAPELLRRLRKIEHLGKHETAHRTRAACSRVFLYAIRTGRADRNVAADLQGALTSVKTKHFAALTDRKEIGALLRAIDGYQGQPAVMAALKLAPLVFVRPGELRAAEWAEFDLEAKHPEWRIPAERMKSRERHLVPLARQAVAILEDLHEITGHGKYVFPGVRDRNRYMSENTITAALRRLGYEGDTMTAHGFRAMASTQLNELGLPPDVIERQLAHKERNEVRAAYNRAERLAERRDMMQQWADYLDGLKADSRGKVAAIRG